MATPEKYLARAAARATTAAPSDATVTGDSGASTPHADYPCSVAQERFWLLDRLDPGNPSFNVAVRWRLEGRISRELLQRAWLEIISRHEILRTVFVEVQGAPIQRVMPHSPFRLVEIDLKHVPQDQRQLEADRIGIMEARAPFDLSTGPLLRATLLRLSATSSIILVTTHQIVSDGWSIGVMAREMGLIYDALRHGNPIPLEELPIQYADYSRWQLEWLRVRGTEAETLYWTKQLAGVKPFKVIPDRRRPVMPTTNGAIVSRVLPRELTSRAQTISAEQGATLFASVSAALCAMLARVTGEEEIVIGTQVSDRDQVELEPMIGQFVNSLILRNDLTGDPRFAELVARVSETSAQALEHRHIPIERLIAMVKGERGHANNAPISVNFIFQKTFIQNTSYSDFTLIDMPSLPAGAIYDLNFFMVERTDGWRFSCQFNTDQFDADTAERLLGYFQRALESGVADPQRRVSELTLCMPGEVRRLLAKLNDTRSLYPRNLTLAKLFEAQVTRTPDVVALACEDAQMTYAELDAAAEHLARHLTGRGIAARSTIGVCLNRSLELPIAMLAVLKVGAICVPLDPADPPARRDALIRASRAAAVLVEHIPRGATAEEKGKLIDVRAAALRAAPHADQADEASPPTVEADSAAFLVFPSGASTDTAAELISHRNLSNLICSLAKRPGINDRDVMVATSPPGLDRALPEMLLPLLTGARLVIAADTELADGRLLLQRLQRSGATIMHAAPHVWARLVESDWVGYPALKMMCSGVELSPPLAARLLALGGELWVLHGYPETGIWSSAVRLKPNQLANCLGEPIGEPIANTALYVLDARLQAAPVGATGILYVGGDGLAETFAAQSPAPPAATVVADPLGLMQRMRLFRTNDLVRLRASGTIEYLGRADHQFSYRGRRVDPATIERLLLEDGRIAQAAVVLCGEREGTGARLSAHVVVRPEQAHDPESLIRELHASLAASLTHELVPGSILLRASLPQLPNGGVDRRALQMNDAPASGAEEAPSGEIEQGLAQMWASMLGLESVAATDNFFELGGHSLLAARVLAQIERVFGRRLKLATLFSAPTVRELATILSRPDMREFDFRQMVKIQPYGSKPALIAINNTGVYYGLAKCLGDDQPVVSLQLFDPSVRTAKMPDTLEEIASGYVDLIRRVQPQAPYVLMGWCVAGALAFEIARQLTEAGDEVAHLFLIDSWVPRYFSRQPPLRGWIGDCTLRAQLILAEWRRVVAGELSLREFLSNRMIIKDWRRLIGGFDRNRQFNDVSPVADYATLETYDQWLLGYLQKVTERYEPRRYPVKVTLLRSRDEPTGWFFKPDAGWAAFSSERVEVAFVDGNHFTMFKNPGVAEMARHIALAMQPIALKTAATSVSSDT